MLWYRLQSHSNFSPPLIISSLEYLISESIIALTPLVLRHYFNKHFPGDIRYLFAEYMRAYAQITSLSVEIP